MKIINFINTVPSFKHRIKRIILTACLIIPFRLCAQIVIKGGISFANRWDENLNGQTLGKGFALSGEKYILPNLSIGTELSYQNFQPNKLINISYKSLDLLSTFYFTNKRMLPYLSIGIGITKYQDKTTLDLGGGLIAKQIRDKFYGNISPSLGLKYKLGKENRVAIFIQSNANFVPVVNIAPIGFLSISSGLSIKL